MEIFLSVMIFVLGLCLGSFVNMLVYRTAVKYGLRKLKFKIHPLILSFDLKDGKSLIKEKRSFCDGCGRQLFWYENIPVISWILQNGKTRCCKKKLPVAYPITELIMGVLFLINFQISQFHFVSLEMTMIDLLSFIIIVFLVFSAVFDLKYMILPDFSTIILIICAVIFLIIGRPQESFLQHILTGLAVTGFFWLLHFFTKGKGMGMGDVKLVFFIGLFLEWQEIVVALYTAFIVGAITGVILILLNKAKRKTEIAFGPFLILGTFVGWWLGEKIWYYVLNVMF